MTREYNEGTLEGHVESDPSGQKMGWVLICLLVRT
jgi:hypothetical protein